MEIFLNLGWQANETQSHIALQCGKAGTRMMNDNEQEQQEQQEPGSSCPTGHGGPSQLLQFRNGTKTH